MSKLLNSVFFDNPQLSSEVYTYCKSLPEYNEAEREYAAMLEKLKNLLGWEQFQRLEDCFCSYEAHLVQAYYLFGLGLRQEVLWALDRK